MVSESVRVDEDIVNQDVTEFASVSIKYFVHHPLENSGSVLEAERHHFKLEETKRTSKAS